MAEPVKDEIVVKPEPMDQVPSEQPQVPAPTPAAPASATPVVKKEEPKQEGKAADTKQTAVVEKKEVDSNVFWDRLKRFFETWKVCHPRTTFSLRRKSISRYIHCCVARKLGQRKQRGSCRLCVGRFWQTG
jgi:hypothetical protein